MIITPDFTEAVSYTPVAQGVYLTRIVGVEPKTSKKGAAYLKWDLQIFNATGEYATFNNRHVYLSTMTSGKGAGILRDLAVAAVGTVPTPFNTDVLIGREILATIKPGTDSNGQLTDKWVDVTRVSKVQ